MYHKQVTIKDICNFLHEYGYSLMLHTENENIQLFKVKEWFTQYYSDNAIDFDNWIVGTYGDFSFINTMLFPNIEDIKDSTKWTQTLLNKCVAFLKSQYNGVAVVHEYEINKLINTTNLEYNPIENYSMKESGTDTYEKTNSGNINNSDSYSSNVSESLGDVIESTSTTHDTNVQNPSKTDITESYVSPYDSEVYTPKDRSETTSTYSSDVVTTENSSVNNTKNAVSNSQSNEGSGSSSNTFSNTEQNETTHTFERSGNIGTLTTQEMIKSERSIAEFSIFSHFWALVHNDCLILLDESADWNDCIFG